MSIEAYRHLVNTCARDRLNQAIPNSSPEHAKVLITKLFEVAREDICLLSGSLIETADNGCEVYSDPDLIEHARNFLRRPGTSLRIIVQSDPQNGWHNKFLRALFDDGERAGELEIHRGNGAIAQSDVPHFMVSDNIAYRFETNTADATAVANFGDPKSARELSGFFRDLWNAVQSVDISTQLLARAA